MDESKNGGDSHETQRSQTPCRAGLLRHLHGVIAVADMLALPPDRYILIQIKEEACMKYISARDILPDSLLKELQTYVQGGYLYIPVDGKRHGHWGEASGYRRELDERNQKIRSEYRNGNPVQTLSDKYCLSAHAIRKIIYQK